MPSISSQHSMLSEVAAREELLKLGKANNMYFVVWNVHLNRWFVGVKNSRRKKTEIYNAMYESYVDLVGDDEQVWRFTIPSSFKWKDILCIARSYFPRTVHFS